MTTVKSWLGCGFSKLRKVGVPRMLSAKRVPTTLPHTMAASPIWSFASAAVYFFGSSFGSCAAAFHVANSTHKAKAQHFDLRVIWTVSLACTSVLLEGAQLAVGVT